MLFFAKYHVENLPKKRRSLSDTESLCNLAGKIRVFKKMLQNPLFCLKLTKSLKTFSGIYNICCLFQGKRKMAKVVLGIRSLFAIVEGLVGSISLFYPNQTGTTFKLFETFVSLAVVDIFLVRLLNDGF